MISVATAIGSIAVAAGCNGDFAADGQMDDSESFGDTGSLNDSVMSNEDTTADAEAEASEFGTAQQAWFSNPFSFTSSCTDSKGTNSVMAALAVATATELKRWQPTKDFVSSGGMVKLTATGKAQCSDGKCWNTQAVLDLQSAPSGTVQLRPGAMLDSSALKSALTTNLALQMFSWSSLLVPEHKFALMYSEAGGCDQMFWFNVTSPTGGSVTSLLTSLLDKRLKWVGGDNNPYIQFQSSGTMVGIDPTYGLNESGATAAGSCTAACTKLSSTDVSGSCCSCNGTKKFVRSVWSASTYICQ